MTTLTRRQSRWTPLGVAATVLGFMTWWPLGLAAIAYIQWGGSIDDLASDGLRNIKSMISGTARASGNAAFDAYRSETLNRLEQERAEFAIYMANLREARDEEEFKRFIAERDRQAAKKKS